MDEEPNEAERRRRRRLCQTATGTHSDAPSNVRAARRHAGGIQTPSHRGGRHWVAALRLRLQLQLQLQRAAASAPPTRLDLRTLAVAPLLARRDRRDSKGSSPSRRHPRLARLQPKMAISLSLALSACEARRRGLALVSERAPGVLPAGLSLSVGTKRGPAGRLLNRVQDWHFGCNGAAPHPSLFRLS